MLDETRLAELEKLCATATPGPWTAFVWIDVPIESVSPSELDAAMRGDDPDAANVGKVFKLNPHDDRLFDDIVRKQEDRIKDDNKDDDIDNYTPLTVPDNGVTIASKREVNRGYDILTGESVHPEDLYLRAGDARVIAEARTAIPELITEVRRLRALLDGAGN